MAKWQMCEQVSNNPWSNEKIINFINEIHVRPELWDLECFSYKDRNLKKDSWAVVAAKFNVTPDEAYKKFRNLRTYAQVEKKKNDGMVGKKQSWFAYEAISFIFSRDASDTGPKSENTIDNTKSGRVDDYEIFEDPLESLSPPLTKKICNKPTYKPQEMEMVLEEAVQISNNSGQGRNPYTGYGEYIAHKLCSYDSFTRSQVEFKISKILYDADMGVLKPEPF